MAHNKSRWIVINYRLGLKCEVTACRSHDVVCVDLVTVLPNLITRTKYKNGFSFVITDWLLQKLASFPGSCGPPQQPGNEAMQKRAWYMYNRRLLCTLNMRHEWETFNSFPVAAVSDCHLTVALIDILVCFDYCHSALPIDKLAKGITHALFLLLNYTNLM